MARRLFDLTAALLALAVLSPLFGLVALGILCTDGLPVLYQARRVGLGGRPFCMLKFRSMRLRSNTSDALITGARDQRVFRFGRVIRLLKLDEIPQLVNILRGDMAFIGPRPEDPEIVARWYTEMCRETLRVRPGLASPGSIYVYTHGEDLVGDQDPERDYVIRLLPIKMALDVVYVRKRTLGYDLRIVLRTVWTIIRIACGVRGFAAPPEYEEARLLADADELARRSKYLEATRCSSS